MNHLNDIYNIYYSEIITIFIILLLSIPATLFIKNIIISTLNKYLLKNYQHCDEILRYNHVYNNLFHVLLSTYFLFCDNLLLDDDNIKNILIKMKDSVIITYVIISITKFSLSLIETISKIYQNNTKELRILAPVSLYMQILKIIIIFIATLVGLSKIFNVSLSAFFTSLGAATALITFIFKDSVMGVLASLQLIAQDIIRIGDKIIISHFKIEGVVEKITISIVKIRNYDQTISIIPTYSLITNHIINLRNISSDVKSKQIKRRINIDMNTIQFIDDNIMAQLTNSVHLNKNIIYSLPSNSPNNLNITNIKLYMEYLELYLRNNIFINKEKFTITVKQLEATPTGIPLEINCFTYKTNSYEYDILQNEIFDYAIAIIPEFNLKIYQQT